MKQLVKRVLYSVAPKWTTALISARSRAHSHRLVTSWGCGVINQKLIDRLGDRVQEGPFAGLVLTEMTRREHLGPYLLGLYESEIDEAWATVFAGAYTQILDIGAKFGYYAVGLAKRFPGASVVAFDTDWWARQAVREMAAANGTPNVEIQGFCSPEWLAQNVQDASLILSDCEGYESALFSPETIPRLRSATIIIETHDGVVPGVSDRLRSAFAETHSVRVFGLEPRRTTSHPLDFLSEAERQLAVKEVRSVQTWLLCLPRTGPNLGLEQSRDAATVSGPSPT